MKIFITGASGFVGKSLIEDLARVGHEVHGLVRNKGSEETLIRLGAHPKIGDLLEIQDYSNMVKGMDVIIHLGALVRFVGVFEDFYRMNVLPTRKLIESAVDEQVKQFIYVSAAATALNGKPLINITEEYEPETRIKSHYLKSKLMAEQVLLEKKKDIQVTILRPPVIWGPGMRIMESFRNTIRLIGFPTIGEKDHHLATCHVKNLNAAILKCLLNAKAEGIFLIGDEEKVKIRAFMNELIKGYGLKMGNMHISRKTALIMAGMMESVWNIFHLHGNPPITTLIAHLMGTEFTIDDGKAKREFGYEQVISVAAGLRQLKGDQH